LGLRVLVIHEGFKGVDPKCRKGVQEELVHLWIIGLYMKSSFVLIFVVIQCNNKIAH
jgi:hypothetical protein